LAKTEVTSLLHSKLKLQLRKAGKKGRGIVAARGGGVGKAAESIEREGVWERGVHILNDLGLGQKSKKEIARGRKQFQGAT